MKADIDCCTKDGRYSFNKEFCGYSDSRYVLRFAGKFIKPFTDKSDAIALGNVHKQALSWLCQGFTLSTIAEHFDINSDELRRLLSTQ